MARVTRNRMLLWLMVAFTATPILLGLPAVILAQIGQPGVTSPPPTYTGGAITTPLLAPAGTQTAPGVSFSVAPAHGMWATANTLFLGAYADANNHAKCDWWAGDVMRCQSQAGAANTSRWYLDPSGASFDISGTFGTTNTFTVSGSVGSKGTKIQSTDGTETISVDANFDKGVVLLTFGSKPTCNVNARGAIWYAQGGAGVADTHEVCLKNAADAYNWVVVATP